MAYDEDLANRIREALADEKFVEQRMFGGLAFLIGGHTSVAVSHAGGLLSRVADDEYETASHEPHVGDFVMRGRAMRGWLRVGVAGVESDADLARWVERGVRVARSLPPKG
ncbi:MAG: hypothetical protein QOI80_834 [Solirubrobacteraceae bacterium]|jgi:hypothetical protein|nr:hypothetical protein [Solirubrobacteraceae bacterium]